MWLKPYNNFIINSQMIVRPSRDTCDVIFAQRQFIGSCSNCTERRTIVEVGFCWIWICFFLFKNINGRLLINLSVIPIKMIRCPLCHENLNQTTWKQHYLQFPGCIGNSKRRMKKWLFFGTKFYYAIFTFNAFTLFRALLLTVPQLL